MLPTMYVRTPPWPRSRRALLAAAAAALALALLMPAAPVHVGGAATPAASRVA